VRFRAGRRIQAKLGETTTIILNRETKQDTTDEFSESDTAGEFGPNGVESRPLERGRLVRLRPQEGSSVPEETALVAHPAFPHANIRMRMRDHFGSLLHEQIFKALFSTRGQSEAPACLALVTVFQFAENLSDRQTATVVRARIERICRPGFPIRLRRQTGDLSSRPSQIRLERSGRPAWEGGPDQVLGGGLCPCPVHVLCTRQVQKQSRPSPCPPNNGIVPSWLPVREKRPRNTTPRILGVLGSRARFSRGFARLTHGGRAMSAWSKLTCSMWRSRPRPTVCASGIGWTRCPWPRLGNPLLSGAGHPPFLPDLVDRIRQWYRCGRTLFLLTLTPTPFQEKL
jgi:hypothetical protein